MAEVAGTGSPRILLSARRIGRRVDDLAGRLAPLIDDEWVVAPILLGALWFAVDLGRALARRGVVPRFDAMWLSSYGEGRTSGRVEVRAGLQRPLAGRPALVLDEVIETGASLAEAVRLARAAGASRVLTAVFAAKPPPRSRAIEPDFAAWTAPDVFLVGYGMDDAGAQRAQPWIGALA